MRVGSVNGSAGRASENWTSKCLVTGARDGVSVGVGDGVGEGSVMELMSLTVFGVERGEVVVIFGQHATGGGP